MTKSPMADALRKKIIANPDVLLEDHDVMRALVGANQDRMGENIVDLRAIAMDRLEARFDRLEDTHRSVIAAAYDNLAGTNQVHRAILRMLDADTLESFLTDLAGDVADTLRVDALRLVHETPTAEPGATLPDTIASVAPGFVKTYVTLGRNMPARKITLRRFQSGDDSLYGDRGPHIQSEACLLLDLGPNQSAAMLVMGSEDPQQFTPQQGTDLLTFFSGVLERVLRRWLA